MLIGAVMRTLERVVIATDFSPNARRAVARAALLPLDEAAEVTLLHVLAPHPFAPKRKVESRARDELEATRRALEKRLGRKVEALLADGEPFVQIVRATRQRRADLVVLGRHSRGRSPLALGTTAERVVQKGSVPALVVRPDVVRPYERPVVAIDRSDVAPTIIDLARLVLGAQAPLRLVHAYHVPFAGFMQMSVSEREIETFRKDLRAEAHAAVKELVDSYGSDAHGWHMSIRSGEPSAVIMRELMHRAADVVVLGTHGRSGLSHFLLGSVAEVILEEAPCDVLIGRPERFTFELP